MSSVATDQEALQREIAKRLAIVNKKAHRYRVQNTVLLVIGLVGGLLAAGLAGDSAIGGDIAPAVAEATTGTPPSELPRGWQNVCGVIAGLSFIGAAANGLNRILKMQEHQVKAFICAGTLDALQATLLSGADAETVAKVASDLVDLLRNYPEYVR